MSDIEGDIQGDGPGRGMRVRGNRPGISEITPESDPTFSQKRVPPHLHLVADRAAHLYAESNTNRNDVGEFANGYMRLYNEVYNRIVDKYI